MAEIFPNEGLDLIYGVVPKGAASPANTWIGLFTAYSASTVGTSAAALASWTEATFGAYTRMTISSSSWGTAGTTQSGRGSAAAQVTFPTSTGTQNTINGFFIVNQLATSGGTVYYGANFDDTTAVVINTNDVIKVTPTWVYTG